MVNIDRLLSESSNFESKQNTKASSNGDDGDSAIFATLYSSQISESNQSDDKELKGTHKEKNNEGSGNNLPVTSEETALINTDDNLLSAEVDLAKSDNTLNKALLTEDLLSGDLSIAPDTSNNAGSTENSVFSFLSQLQQSYKTQLVVSDAVIKVENKSDIQKMINSGNIISNNEIKDDKNDFISKEITDLKGNLSYFDEKVVKENKPNIQLMSDHKPVEMLDVKRDKKIGNSSDSEISPKLFNQLKQLLPQLSPEQKNELKLVLGAIFPIDESGALEGDNTEKLSQLLSQVEVLSKKSEAIINEGVEKELLNLDKLNSSQGEKKPITSDKYVGAPIIDKIADEKSFDLKDDAVYFDSLPALPEEIKFVENANIAQLASQLQSQNTHQGKDTAQKTLESNNSYIKKYDSEFSKDEVLPENVKLDAEIKTQQVNPALNTENLVSNQMTKSQVNSVFNDLIRQLDPNSSAAVESDSIIEQTDSLSTPANTSSHTSINTKLETEKLLQQPINIARSDAAKLLNERVTFLLSQHKPEADIRLDPPELGSMIIRVRTDAEQAQINFTVQNQQAKELLEQSMPKLREMLAEQGIDLGESDIQQQSQDQGDDSDSNQRGNAQNDNASEQEEVLATVKVAGNKLGGVDFYA
ncbi:flagellar hook-length control protein FliK [Pseudoalteromonas denitrificans]|uniref:Hook-length control protein FliK n=1 Tax=Pseudoalteromonas denitrificans DSM 6059 TaxID=1123010 RepID=A0A1I1HIA7_9GAMM|nr:flagellar hook-length control protein FliK [Pseudoalteromonas denitrificans]SFC23546.1 hook-length control protein FliK [Pseudoalteromonas denitrificans DSM 6059]